MVTEFDTYGGRERLNPDMLRSASFPSARLGRRGLDETSVQAFCTWAADQVVGLMNDRAHLEAEVLRLRDRAVGRATPEDGQAQAVAILARAQQTADQYVASAQEYSKELAADARRHGEEILNEARAHAGAIIDDAQVRASRAAEAVPAASGREPMTADERRDLEAELAYLRTFSEVCRTHLRAYLDSLARSIEEWERAEKSSATSAAAAGRG
jgi:cell division septum initiation protein DivIVA